MKFRFTRRNLLLGVVGLLIVGGIVWFFASKANQDVVVPPDFQVERKVIAEGSGEVMTHLGVYVDKGVLWYDNREQSRKLTDSELKTLVSKNPWPANDNYTSDGGGDTALTSLTITSNGEVTKIEFDNAWGTKVAKQVLEFDAYLHELAGYPAYQTHPR